MRSPPPFVVATFSVRVHPSESVTTPFVATLIAPPLPALFCVKALASTTRRAQHFSSAPTDIAPPKSPAELREKVHSVTFAPPYTAIAPPEASPSSA